MNVRHLSESLVPETALILNPILIHQKPVISHIPGFHQISLQLLQRVRVVRLYNDHRRVAYPLAQSQDLLIRHPVRVDELLKLANRRKKER